MSKAEEVECLQCGLVDGVPMMDKLSVVAGSLFIVYLIRWTCQAFVTRVLKKEPWGPLEFPNWEGPLMLVHWFGMCNSLVASLGRPCPSVYGVAAGFLFFGPICMMLFALFSIHRLVKNGDMVFVEHESITWTETRKKMRASTGIFNKFKAFNEWVTYKRHHGEWEEHTKKGKHWDFLVKDFSSRSYWYFGW